MRETASSPPLSMYLPICFSVSLRHPPFPHSKQNDAVMRKCFAFYFLTAEIAEEADIVSYSNCYACHKPPS